MGTLSRMMNRKITQRQQNDSTGLSCSATYVHRIPNLSPGLTRIFLQLAICNLKLVAKVNFAFNRSILPYSRKRIWYTMHTMFSDVIHTGRGFGDKIENNHTVDAFTHS